jgi:NitT/TauT family transport system ATP-binding protein
VDAGVLDIHITCKRLGDRAVLQNLSLRLVAGEVVALTGPSGRGKTTLLHIAAGLDSAFSGQRTLAPGVRLSMIFQEPRLLPWRSTADNLALCNPPGGAAATTAALSAIGLGGNEDLYPRQLSLGMQRRVAVARALVMAPTLLIADEPLASLDAASAATVRALLTAEAKQRHCAVLIATHSPQDVALADRVVALGP